MLNATNQDRTQLAGNLWAFRVSLARCQHPLDISPGTNVHPLQLVRVGVTYLLKRPVSSLSESTMKELRSALSEQLKRPDGPTPELANLLKRIAREAHDNGVQPEKLIVIFKQLWNSLAESLRPQNADQYERVRQRLVTLCIQAYYAE